MTLVGNGYGIPPKEALGMICRICEEEYAKGKRKVNINRVWNLADRGFCYEYDTRTDPITGFIGNGTEAST